MIAPSLVNALDAEENDYEFQDSIANGKLPEEAVTLPVYVDPNKTPEPTPEVVEATRAPKLTPEPAASADPEEPVLKPEVPVDRGIKFTNVVVNGNKATMDVEYVGYPNGISAATVAFAVPTGVTVKATATSTFTAGTDSNTVDGVFTLKYGAGGNLGKGETKLASLEVEFPADAKSFQFELIAPSLVNALDAEENDYEFQDSIANAKLPAAIATVEVGGGDTPVVTPEPEKQEVAVKDHVDADKAANETVENEGTDNAASDYRLIISVTDKSGNDVPYGDGGFVAKFNGNPLTEAQYKNLVEGYLDPSIGANSMQDIINGLTLEVFADGANVSVKLRDPSGLIVDKGEETVSFGPVRPTPAPKFTVKTKAGSKNETTSKNVTAADGTTVRVTAAYDKPVEGGMYKIAYNNEADKDYLALLTNAEVADGIFRFAVDKAGRSVKLVVSYVDGDKELAKSDLTIRTVTADDDDSDDDGDSDSSGNKGGGSIAYPGSSVNNNNQGKIAFKDLDTVPWAEDAILALVNKNVINGRSNTIFDPNGTVTRAEFAKMVVLGFNLTGGTASNFSDVATGDWFAPYVATGYNSGVISGYDDGTFRPNGLISRQEMAAMISRAIAAANKTAPATVEAVSFDDAWQIGSWAIDSVTTLQRAGIINGMTATTFEPLANATRAQAAVIINRAMTIAK